MPVTINGSNTPTAGGVTYGDGTTYANTAAGSAGGVLYSAGSSAPAFTAAGTSGQVLTSAGASAPTWATPVPGALILISTQTVSTAVASVDFTSGISSTYDDYVVYFSNVTPGTNSTAFYSRLYKSGAFATSGYSQSLANLQGTPVYTASNSATQINITSATVSSTVSILNGSCTLFNMNSVLGNRATVIGQAFFNTASSTAQIVTVFGGNQSTAAATTGFQFYFSSGNIASGTFRLYGVAK